MGLPSRSGNDRQAAEEFEMLIVFLAWLAKSQAICFGCYLKATLSVEHLQKSIR
jgi:hypothetical protein